MSLDITTRLKVLRHVLPFVSDIVPGKSCYRNMILNVCYNYLLPTNQGSIGFVRAVSWIGREIRVNIE